MNDDIHAQISDFFSSYPELHYPKDQILIFPTEHVGKVFYMSEGRVCQYGISYRGDEIIVNTFKPPAFFPMSLAIHSTPSNFFYKTEAATIVRVAPARDVVTFVRSDPEIVYDLLSRVYTGIESVLERMLHLMSGTARSRLLFELLVEFKRFGNATDNEGYLEINEASIAARSGLSRETVSREMKHLKAAQLAQIQGGKIYIMNVTALEAQLGAHL